MKVMNLLMKFRPGKSPILPTPVMKNDAEAALKAEAKAANRLPRAQQLTEFEKDLEAHDSGNQPA